MRRHSIAWPLLIAYTGVLLYASLYPFLDWRDKGIVPWAFLFQSAPRFVWSSFDNIINVLGYMPFGLLLALGILRTRAEGARPPSRWPWLRSCGIVLIAALIASAMSLLMECLQSYLPTRRPSALDWGTNTAGAALGAALAVVLDAMGLTARWTVLRQRWFVPDSSWGIAILALWPVALLYPAAVPLGLGHVSERIEIWLTNQFAGSVSGALGLLSIISAPAGSVELQALAPTGELLCVALGVLGPAMLSHALVLSAIRRALALMALTFAAWSVITLSSALSFGPANAWAWWSLQVQVGWIVGATVALVCVGLQRRTCATLGLLALVVQLSMLNQASSSAYFWQTLQTWEQGRFIQFHGLSQWMGWLWPFAAVVWLMGRVTGSGGRRHQGGAGNFETTDSIQSRN